MIFPIIVATIFSGYEFQTEVGNINAERVIIFPLFFLSILFLKKSNKNIPYTFYCAAFIIIFAFIVSILSPVSYWAVKMSIAFSAAVLYYFVSFFYSTNFFVDVFSRKFFALEFFVGPVCVLVYILCGVLDVEFMGFLDSWVQRDSAGVRLRGPVVEANIYACIASIFILIRVFFGFNGWAQRVNFILMVIALILSNSRGPTLALIVSIIYCSIISKDEKINIVSILNHIYKHFLYIFPILLTAVLGLFFYIDEDVSVARVNTVEARFVMWDLAMNSIYESKFFGNGVMSFSEMNPDAPLYVGSDSYRSAWISNIFIAIYHDFGVIFGTFFVGFLFSFIMKAAIFARYFARRGDKNRILFSVASSLGLFLILSGLSIPMHTMGFFWVVFGVIGRALSND